MSESVLVRVLIKFGYGNKSSQCPEEPITSGTRTKAWVCGCSLSGMVLSDPAGSMDAFSL